MNRLAGVSQLLLATLLVSCQAGATTAVVTPIADSVSLGVNFIEVAEGATLPLVATVFDRGGDVLPAVELQWSSSDQTRVGIVPVDQRTILVEGISVGSATITVVASSGGSVASTQIQATVLPDEEDPSDPVVVAPDFSETIERYLALVDSLGQARWEQDVDLSAQKRNFYDRSYAWYALGYPDRGAAESRAELDEVVIPSG